MVYGQSHENVHDLMVERSVIHFITMTFDWWSPLKSHCISDIELSSGRVTLLSRTYQLKKLPI